MNLTSNKTKFQRLLAPEGETGSGEPPAGDDTVPAGDDTVAAGADTIPAGDDTIAGGDGPDLSWLPSDFQGDDGPDLNGFKEHYEELAAAQAIAAEANQDVPEDPTGYEFAVPEDIDFGELPLPENYSTKLKADDPAMAPLFEELGGMMHELGLPKSATPKLMGLLAKYEATKYSGFYTAGQQQMETLGPTANARISNVQRALESKLPAEHAKALSAAVTTADGVRALEKLLAPRGMTTPTPEPKPATEEDHLNSRYPSTA